MISNIKLCLRYWWVILIITAITSGAAAYLSVYFISPKYSTSTTLYILKMSDKAAATANNESVYQNLLASQMLVADYREMVKTSLIIEKVKDDLQDSFPSLRNESLKSLSDSITVSTKPETRLIDISVMHNDPKAASAIANKIAEIFRDKSLELLKTESVTIINNAAVPGNPVSPKPVQDTIMGFLAGLAGSVAVILFLSYIRKQIKNDEQGKTA